MSNLMKIYQDKYNTKYNTQLNFAGKIKAFKNNNNQYLIIIDLTVISNGKIDYHFCKEFSIQDPSNYDDKTLTMDGYKFINILNDLDNIICQDDINN